MKLKAYAHTYTIADLHREIAEEVLDMVQNDWVFEPNTGFIAQLGKNGAHVCINLRKTTLMVVGTGVSMKFPAIIVEVSETKTNGETVTSETQLIHTDAMDDGDYIIYEEWDPSKKRGY